MYLLVRYFPTFICNDTVYQYVTDVCEILLSIGDQALFYAMIFTGISGTYNLYMIKKYEGELTVKQIE